MAELAGPTREISFAASVPGTYFYWGTITHKLIVDRNGVDSQLQGAFIIDEPGRIPRPDRVFVLGSWTSLGLRILRPARHQELTSAGHCGPAATDGIINPEPLGA